MKRALLAGMILGLVETWTAYALPTSIVSDGGKWIQIASDEGEEEGDQGNQGGDEDQDENQEEGEPSSEGQDPST